MSAPRTARLAIAAFLAAGCAAAPAPRPEPETVAAVPDPAISVEERLRAVRADLDAAWAAAGDFATTARRLQDAQERLMLVANEVEDPARRRELGFEDLAVRVERERRAILEERLPVEAHRWLRAAADARARKPATPGTDPEAAFEAARRQFLGAVREDLFDHLLRAFFSEEENSEWDGFVAADAAGLDEETKGRFARNTAARKVLRYGLMQLWDRRDKTAFVVTSYGTGTFVVVGVPEMVGRGAREDGVWWENAPAAERADWLLTHCAERGTLFQVLRTWDESCTACEGRGSLQLAGDSPGARRLPICPTCRGCGVVRKVRWR